MATPPPLTLILPTFNESKNIEALLTEISAHPDSKMLERVIVVDDDSPDGTAELVKKIKDKFAFPVGCIHRIGRSGLSSAVVEGVMAASTDYIAVMDADGQHNPADLFAMLREKDAQTQIMIGSRFYGGGKQSSHQGLRSTYSDFGNRLCNLLLRQNLSDPLTGFFIARRDMIAKNAKRLTQTGFKILFSLCFYEGEAKIEERRIDFRNRQAGESKLDGKVMLDFMSQLIEFLTRGIIPSAFVSFAFVGSLGVAIYFAVFYAMRFGGVAFFQTTLLATVVAMVFNYALNNVLTFSRFQKRGLGPWVVGLLGFCLISSVGGVANVGVANYLQGQENPEWRSALVGILVGTVFNFVMSRAYVWRS